MNMNTRTFQDEKTGGFLGIHGVIQVYKKNILRIFSTSMKEKRHDKDPGHQRGRSTPLTSSDHYV